MKLDNISICETQAEFGDAVFTFYRIDLRETSYEQTIKQIHIYHSHFYYECHILLEGETNFLIQGQNIFAQSGALVIISPNTGHHPFQGEANAKEIVLGMTLKQQDKTSGEYAYFKRSLNHVCNNPLYISESLRTAMIRLYNSFRANGIRNECIRKAMTYEIVVSLFEEINHFDVAEECQFHTGGESDYSIALETMVDDVRFSLGDIAASLGYSKRHTARLIMNRYGKSLLQIRRENQISTVKKLLRSTPTPIMAVIALQAGFSSADAMTAAFRKSENMTPTEYKQRMMEHE